MAQKTPSALARQIVEDEIADLFNGDCGWWIQSEHFEALREALTAVNDKVLSLDEVVAIQTRVDEALPEELQRELLKLYEANIAEGIVMAEAGFMIGLEVGRRFAGGKAVR